jgi:hypothetical protein
MAGGGGCCVGRVRLRGFWGQEGGGVVTGCNKVAPLFTGPPRGCLKLCLNCVYKNARKSINILNSSSSSFVVVTLLTSLSH